MPSTIFFLFGTLLLIFNFVRPFGLAISDWIYFISLGLALIETIFIDRKNQYPWMKNRFLWFAYLILIGGIISLAYSKNIKIAIYEVVQQIYVITLFISLIWIMVRRGQTKNILLVFVISGTFAASVAIIDYITGSRIGPYLSGTPNVQLWYRYAGPLGHPNKLGFFLSITSTITFSWLMGIKSPLSISTTRIMWFLLLAIQIFGLYLSGSLTAYLGLSLGILFIIVSHKSITSRIMKLVIAILLICYFAVSIIVTFDIMKFNNIYVGENSLIINAIKRVESTTAPSRIAIFNNAIKEIIKHPLIGLGYDQISTSGIEFNNRDLQGTIHNVFLQILYTGGFLTFVGWLAIYISIGWGAVKYIYNRRNKSFSPMITGIAAATLAIILMDQFQDAIYQREKWLIFGLLISLIWSKYTFQNQNI